MKQLIAALARHDGLNFALTNRIPRRALTRLVGWFSKIEQPLVRALSIAAWRLFCDLDLRDSKKTSFASMHDCFTRELKPGARRIDGDPMVLASPCDAIVGACGVIADGIAIQAKGFPYAVDELLADPAFAGTFRDGVFVTLRLGAGMYHRFHAPHDCLVQQVTYVGGDVWNVNPAALSRVERLYCRNERAVIRASLSRGGHAIALVPVAAVLVASIRFSFLDVLLHLRYPGPNLIACDARLSKGEEMGWFEHGSTIIVLAPRGFALCDGIAGGARIQMGQALLRLPADGDGL